MLPRRISPMLARLAGAPFDSPDHLFEIKWDGTRCLAFIEKGGVRLQNRSFREIHDRYPEFAGLARLPDGTVLDGEIVVLRDGRPSFPLLQQREGASGRFRVEVLVDRLPATFVAFDLLFRRGKPVMDRPLAERRRLLRAAAEALRGDVHFLLPDFVIGSGVRYFREAVQAGLEGVMAKRLDSPYLPDRRSGLWLKVKRAHTWIFEVLGFTRREGQPGVSALLLGERTERGWRCRGKVGSGLSDELRRELYRRLSAAPPRPDTIRGAPGGSILVRSGLWARVRFLEETKGGRLRAPVLLEVMTGEDGPGGPDG